ncbi:MAG: nucleotidyltransferase [Gracilimonas sp.]|nr:nucleotidyltransferase [Gracilimonas sp.]
MDSAYFSDDTTEFIRLLAKYKVKYLIVGGEAVIYYGYPRLTGDVDFFYSNDSDNVRSLFNALLEFWDDDIPGIDDQKDLSTPGYVIQFGLPPNRIDIMNSIEGVSFEEAWENRKTEFIRSDQQDFPIYYLGLKELIINKRETGRQKDMDDLDYLKNIEN